MLVSSINRKVIRAFDRSSERYARHAGFQEEIARETARMAMPHARPGWKTLEIGCGPGALTAHIIPQAKPSLAAALDASSGMCRMAARRLWPLGAQVIRAQAESLPFPRGKFDAALSSLALQWVQDIEAAFMETARVLRPGGVFIAATLGPGTFPELRRAVDRALEGKQSYAQTAESFASIAEIESALKRAGFSAQIKRSARARRYEGFHDFLLSLKNVGAMGKPAARGAGLSRRNFLRRVEREYAAALQGQDGFTATYEVLFIQARLAK